jgi:hypothetical protein
MQQYDPLTTTANLEASYPQSAPWKEEESVNRKNAWWRPGRLVTASSFGLATMWFPLSIVLLGVHWHDKKSVTFYVYLFFVASFLTFWPSAILRMLAQRHINQLWSTAVFLPIVLLVASAFEPWPTLTMFILPLSMIAPWPFLLVKPREAQAAEEGETTLP